MRVSNKRHILYFNTLLTTLLALIALIVGKLIPVKLAIVADMNIVLFDFATPYK